MADQKSEIRYLTAPSIDTMQDAIHTVQPTIPISRIHFLLTVIILSLLIFC